MAIRILFSFLFQVTIDVASPEAGVIEKVKYLCSLLASSLLS
jgi:hypothetical protein